MDKNKLMPAKAILLVIVILFVGMLSYGLIFSKPIPPAPVSVPECPATITDIDGNVYKTVLIGSQCWMKENLKVTKNPKGNAVTRYCYNNDPKNCETDGGLYDWNTTMNGSVQEGAQGICPTDWHVPKDSEWYTLENGLAVGSCDVNKTESQNENCKQTNVRLMLGGDSGFNAISAGYKLPINTTKFYSKTTDAYFWSSTDDKQKSNSNLAQSRYLSPTTITLVGDLRDKLYGFSVRCLKN